MLIRKYLICWMMVAMGAGSCAFQMDGPNLEPVALAGPDQTVLTGFEVLLDGTQSYDPDGSALTYGWMIVARPNGSEADIEFDDKASASLRPDVPGAWVIRLRVTDDREASACDLMRVEAKARPCEQDSDCEDQNPCTHDRCEDLKCRNIPADGLACDDGLFCTESDVCQDRNCAGSPIECLPGENPCNTAVCDEDQDRCLLVPLPDGTACDDELFCTVGDTCLSGSCVGGGRDCSPEAGECQSAQCDEDDDRCEVEDLDDGEACDDGLWCTVSDLCVSGSCGGIPRDCGAQGGTCRMGACDEEQDRCTGLALPENTPCNDDLFCNGQDFCDSQGNCAVHAGDPCAGGGECNQQCNEDFDNCFDPAQTACGDGTSTNCDESDSCDGEGHCQPNHVDNGTTCDDALACTVSETCQAGVCVGLDRDCSSIQAPQCQVAVCDENAGGCTLEPLPDGSDCDDGLYCTEDDECEAGQCLGDDEIDCDDQDPCTTDSCSNENQSCQHVPQPNPGAEGPNMGTCENGIDDDCDGLIDEKDTDCCTPYCGDRECGDDGCGGECGECPYSNQICSWQGYCFPNWGGSWALIEAGTFEMGSPTSELGRDGDESRHPVRLTRNFLMQTTEVTRGQFMEAIGVAFGGTSCDQDDCPVARVSFPEAALYCNALSEADGRASCYHCYSSFNTLICHLQADYQTPYECPGYRLPTEAEWEYAARAGTNTATYNGDLSGQELYCENPNSILDPVAWFCGNTSGTYLRTVASLQPNGFGLYDMLGNAAEWCQDGYKDDYGDIDDSGELVDPYVQAAAYDSHVIRGGAGEFQAKHSRSASRMSAWFTEHFTWLGFRPVRTILP